MADIGFIGAGNMGGPMLANLVKAGHSVTVFDLVRAALEVAEGAGASLAATPGDAATSRDAVITMLPAGAQVREVYTAEGGVLEGAAEGTLLVDCSTIDVTTAREVCQAAAARGLDMLDAPVSGGEPGAVAGTLAVMVGGKQEVFDKNLDLMNVMGGNVVLTGDIGAGGVTKLANQIIVAITIGAVSEAFILAGAGGADRAKVREALQGGFASSRILNEHGLRMVERDFDPGGPAKFQTKDLRNALAAAEEADLDLPVTRLLHELFAAMTAGSLAERDHSALLVHLEQHNGLAAPEA